MISKTIAFITENYIFPPFGGEPAIAYNLIEYLETNGYKIDVYCEKTNILNKVGKSINSTFSNNSNNYIKKINSGEYNFVLGSKFALKYPDLKIDLYSIHSHSDLFSQRKKNGILHKLLKSKRIKIKKEINSLNLHRDSMYVFSSKQLFDDYNSLCKLKNSKILNPYPNCIPPNNYVKQQNDIFVFGLSATGFQNKGGYLVLKSAFLLKLLGKDFKLRIIYKANGGLLQNIIVSLLGLNKKVEFIQKQSNMQDFYSNIDCLLMPSKLESFGMVAVEAMSFGVPVIVSSSSGISDLIINNRNGIVFNFDKNNLINLFRAMQNVMQNKLLIENASKQHLPLELNKDFYNESLKNLIEDFLRSTNENILK